MNFVSTSALDIGFILEKPRNGSLFYYVVETNEAKNEIWIVAKNIGNYTKLRGDMVKVRNYKEHLLEQLQDPGEAAAYLNAALQDDDPQSFLLAMRDIAEAQGGMTRLAKDSDLNRENLYRTLSMNGNPRFFNLIAVLDAFGLELSIHPRPKRRQKSAR